MRPNDHTITEDGVTGVLGELYITRVPLVESLPRAGQTQHHGAVTDQYSDICLFGEVYTKVVAGGEQLKEAKASSSRIATPFIGSFMYGLFDKFIGSDPLTTRHCLDIESKRLWAL